MSRSPLLAVAVAVAVAAVSLLACGGEPAPETAAPAAPVAEVPAPAPTTDADTVPVIDASPAGTPPYDFSSPSADFRLPAVLREISGLTVLDGQQLGAVQDEEGDLYAIRMTDGEPVGRIRFGRGGDYEALERVGDVVYVLQSDGDLFELKNWNRGKAPDTRNFETRLGAKACDAEGLGAKGTLLYISCKEEDADGLTRVYRFDPRRAATALYLTLDADDVPGKGALRPSALAFHPVTGHLVLLSAGREALISVRPNGTVADVWDIKPAGLEQPEGLAFLPNGDVFISSEGKSGAGRIVRFEYRG